MDINDLKQKFEAKREEARNLNEAGKVDEAEAAVNEMRSLKKQIVNAEALEEEDKRNLENIKNNKVEGEKRNMEKINEMRALTKKVLGQELTTEERAVITTADHAAVLPKEFINKLQEIKKGFGSLKELCDVIPVSKNEGTMPVVDLDQNEMKDVLEGADIVDGTLVTTDKAFKCGKYGLIQTLSSELIDDAEIEIESLVKKNFAEIAVAKENAKIMKVVNDNAAAVTASDYTALEDVMAKALPGYKAGLVTITNVAGYAHLKNMKDKQGRNLDLITMVGNQEYFNGKPIYVVDDSIVKLTDGKTMVFYSVNMKEAVKFADRKAVSIARSTEAGFVNDTVKIRILERFDVFAGSVRSIKKIEL